MKKIFFYLLIMFLYFPLFSQTGKIQFHEYELSNGLHVILHEDHTIPIVAVSVMYHVGSKNENPERTGFAHFFEHLMFEGSKYIKRGEFDKYLQNVGGTNNANTNQDRTFYYEILPSNNLELALWLESERMLHANVDSIGIETQRQVVKEEKRQRVDNQPYGGLMQETFKRAYSVHPYRWPVIGSMDHLNAASFDDFKDFYNTFYVPNNAVLSIAGDLNIDEAKAMIEKYFGTIPKGSKTLAANYRPEPYLNGEVRDTVYDNIQLPAYVEAYRIPAIGTKDFYSAYMLSQLLSGGNSSRLNKKLIDEEQSAVYVGSFPFPLEDPGIHLVFAVANMGVDAKKIENTIHDEINKIKENPISDQEFQKLRNMVESQFVSDNTSMVSIAENLANYKMFYGNTNLINTELSNFMAVTKEDIQKVAFNYFNEKNRVVLYYLPKEN
ncbi:MAG: insulinase family protein [Saprospiraceae bacterium]|nr:insulinase family protein [Saprospiraceae bacterium]